MLRLLATAALLAAVGVWALPFALRQAAAWLNTGAAPVKAEAAIVLAGGWTGERMLKAGELLRDGYVPLALVSGPRLYYDGAECEIAIRFLARRGFDTGKFHCVATGGDSTREEAVGMVAEMRRRGLRRVLLVTSDFHTRRAAYLYRRQAPELEIHVVAAPTQIFPYERWYRTRAGWKYIFLEWTKLVATWAGV